MSRRIQIFDTTLRDGGGPGVALRPHEKAELAAQLERLGVDVVEAGFPGALPGDLEGVRAVAAAVTRPTVAAFARARRDDVEAAAVALSGAVRSRIHVAAEAAELEAARAAVEHAAARVDDVQLSCADATTADPAAVARLCAVAVEAGASVVGLRDPDGTALPGRYPGLLRDVQRRCPDLARVSLSVHCHDDLGLAVASSLAAVQAGATQVECTVNGLGERAGHAALEEVVVALNVRRDHYDAETGVDTALLATVSRLVAERTGTVVPRNKAVVGANAFAHEAGIHQDGMLKDPRTYQIVDPRDVGVRMTLPLGKHSGRHAFARACAERGVELAGEELNAAFRRFKALADGARPVVLDDVLEGVTA